MSHRCYHYYPFKAISNVDSSTHCMRFTRYASCVNWPLDSTLTSEKFDRLLPIILLDGGSAWSLLRIDDRAPCILVNARWAPSVDIAENRPLVTLSQSSRSGASQSAENSQITNLSIAAKVESITCYSSLLAIRKFSLKLSKPKVNLSQ